MRSRALVLVLALALLAPGLAGRAQATFTGTTSSASSLGAAVLPVPSGLAATRTCSYATPTYVSMAGLEHTGATAIDVDRPAGLVSGDVILAFADTADAGSTRGDPTAPAGWTLLTTSDTTVGYAKAWYRVATGTEPATYRFTGMNVGEISAVILVAYRSVDVAALAVGAAQQSGSTSTAPAVTSRAPRVEVRSWFADHYLGDISSPAGMSDRAYLDGIPDWEMALLTADRTVTGAGTSSTGTATGSLSASGVSHAFTVALPGVLTAAPVTLSWSAEAEPVDGYTWSRDGGPATAVPGRTTTSATDTPDAASSADYELRSTASSWASGPATATAPGCG